MLAIHSARNSFLSLVGVVLFVMTIALLYNSRTVSQNAIPFAPVPAVADETYAARGTKSNEGLLRQAALHLSKMRGGESVGGFPGFEPPEDDKEYRRKIRKENYSAQDVNDWVKEINNYLEQIVKKNPGRSLERILQEQGKTAKEIESLVDALRDAHRTADAMKGSGVNSQTVERIEALMRVLGVKPWNY